MDTNFAKLEANTYILTAKLLYEENMAKARAILDKTEMTSDEIAEFVKDRKQAAEIMVKGYFASVL